MLDSETKFGAWNLLTLINLQNNNGVKHLLVRQDLFDRIVNTKGTKKRNCESLFNHDYRKESTKKIFRLPRDPNLLERLKSSVLLRDTSFFYYERD